MKVLYISNCFSSFEDIVVKVKAISSKSGNFDLLILNGIVFDPSQGLKGLTSLLELKIKVIIHDISRIGVVLKHLKAKTDSEDLQSSTNKHFDPNNLELKEEDEINNKENDNHTIEPSNSCLFDEFDNRYKIEEDYVLLNDYIYLLKRSGIIKIDGIVIAFLNGYESKEFSYYENLEDDSHLSSKYNHNKKIFTGEFFNKQDIEKLVKNKREFVDLLLLHTIPSEILKEFDLMKENPIKKKEIIVDFQKINSKSSLVANYLVKNLFPKYTMVSSGEDFHYERTPFINDLNNKMLDVKIASRVIHFASFSNLLKQNLKEKSLYGLNIEPLNNPDKESNMEVMLNPNIKSISEDEMKEFTINPFKSCPYSIMDLYKKDFAYHTQNINSTINSIPKNNIITSIAQNELYIGNLGSDIKKDELHKFLETNLKIKVNEINFPNKEDICLGYAFIKVSSLNDLKKQEVLSLSNRLSFHGKKIIIREKIEKKLINNANDNKEKDLSCWFCFVNPKIDTSLILNSNFKHFYIAFPKGAIDEYHFLIVAKEHFFSTLDYNNEQLKELNAIIQAIVLFLKKRDLDFISYEKYLPFKDDVFKHNIINIVGINKESTIKVYDFVQDYLVKNKIDFKLENVNKEIMITGGFKPKEVYFYNILFPLNLGENFICRTLIHIPSSQTYNVDTIRKMICLLIEKPENIDWKVSKVQPNNFEKMKEEIDSLIKL